MDRRCDRSGVRRALPDRLAGVQVEAEHHPVVRAGWRIGRRLVAGLRQVQTGSGTLVVRLGDDRRDEDAVVPHDRARPSPARNRRLPGHVVGGAPRFGERGVVSHHRGPLGASELRPVVGCGGCVRRGQQEQEQHRRAHAANVSLHLYLLHVRVVCVSTVSVARTPASSVPMTRHARTPRERAARSGGWRQLFWAPAFIQALMTSSASSVMNEPPWGIRAPTIPARPSSLWIR